MAVTVRIGQVDPRRNHAIGQSTGQAGRPISPRQQLLPLQLDRSPDMLAIVNAKTYQ